MGSGIAILSTAYFPPVQYFTKFLLYSNIKIEKYENYNKQSYRNRCIILGANGPLGLTVPVQKDIHPKINISELKIDYDTNWQKIHWKAMEAAYKRSPFFEYYCDDFRPFFKRRSEFLLPFNSEILEIILKRIGIANLPGYTGSYVEFSMANQDYRTSIHPKSSKLQLDPGFKPKFYNQVFNNKFGFVPNLSILDLLFNEGPNSLSVLRNSTFDI